MKFASTKNKKILIYSVVFFMMFALGMFFLDRAKSRQKELKNKAVPTAIDSSMPINFVIEKFGISEQVMIQELHLPDVHWSQRYTILQACEHSALDCQSVVKDLNQKIIK